MANGRPYAHDMRRIERGGLPQAKVARQMRSEFWFIIMTRRDQCGGLPRGANSRYSNQRLSAA
ncbi:MAG: hypothetical protein RMM98_16925, partial [Acidobacteriota bacterium]|nr:hypothetical protein [Acidobacteriota bacterium]